jgi:glycosyltransferase involved in cell wall biosynthesis
MNEMFFLTNNPEHTGKGKLLRYYREFFKALGYDTALIYSKGNFILDGYIVNNITDIFFPHRFDGNNIIIYGDPTLTPHRGNGAGMVVIHDFFSGNMFTEMKKHLNYALYEKYHIPVITPSEFIAEEARERHFNIVTALYPHLDYQFKKEKKENIILSVGTNDRRKNLDAIREFASRNNGHKFIRVGDSLGIRGENYMEHSYLPEQELQSLYNRAKYLFVPSYAEGLGLPMIEALYHDVVVILNENNPIIRELELHSYRSIVSIQRDSDYHIPEYPPTTEEFSKFRGNYERKIARQYKTIAEYLNLPELMDDNIFAFEISQMGEAMGGAEK